LNEITTIDEPFTNRAGEERERKIVMLKVTLTLDENQIDPTIVGF